MMPLNSAMGLEEKWLLLSGLSMVIGHNECNINTKNNCSLADERLVTKAVNKTGFDCHRYSPFEGIWISYMDETEEGDWIDVHTKKPLEFTNYCDSEPNGGI